MKTFLLKIFGPRVFYSKSMFVGEIGNLQKELTELAIKSSRTQNIYLDFSHESIQKVGLILSKIHNAYKETGNSEGLNGVAFNFGAYIASTIQKSTGKGILEKDHPDFGINSFPFYWNDKILFTSEWCRKRLFDGDGDDITTKYEICVLNNIK